MTKKKPKPSEPGPMETTQQIIHLPKVQPEPAEDPVALGRYTAMLQEIDLLYPDPAPDGSRGGPVDVQRIQTAIRRALADCPGVDDYWPTGLAYAFAVQSEVACDLAEHFAQHAEDWPSAKRLLDRHFAAQSQSCTVLGLFLRHVLEQVRERRASQGT